MISIIFKGEWFFVSARIASQDLDFVGSVFPTLSYLGIFAALRFLRRVFIFRAQARKHSYLLSAVVKYSEHKVIGPFQVV